MSCLVERHIKKTFIALGPDCKPTRVQRQAFSRQDPETFVYGKPLIQVLLQTVKTRMK